MVSRNVVVTESDISGKPNAATVTFCVADTWYEVDLTDDEQQGFEQALQPYLEVSRKSGQKTAAKRVVLETTAEEREQIRAWAKEEGLEVAERGQIPKNILKAYDKAHDIQ
jgi:hypothetical protein